MERLTMKTEDGYERVSIWTKNQQLIDKLADYEDLEELADSLTATAKCDECFVIKEHESYCLSTSACRQKHLEWLQSEAE